MPEQISTWPQTPADGSARAAWLRRRPRLWLFCAIFLPFMTIYLSTANTVLPYHIDAATNVFTAWSIGTTGSPVLEDHAVVAQPENRAVFAWAVESSRGPIAQYPPGTALLAAPLYATLWRSADIAELSASNAPDRPPVPLPLPSLTPGAIVGSATTAAALGFLALTLVAIGFSRRVAATSVVLLGLGTGAWSVAADGLWQHGPNMLWISLALYCIARNRWLAAGLCFSALAMTRPPVLILGAAIGTLLVLERRRQPAIRMLVGVIPGVVSLVAYNWWLFGGFTLSGGYGDVYARRAVDPDLAGYFGNVLDGLVGPQVGVFTWSPFILLAIVVVGRPMLQMPSWAIAAALGAVAYLLVVFKIEPASGGGGFSYYRYPLEAITASSPLLAAGWQRLWHMGPVSRIALSATATFGVVAHAIAAV